MQESREAPPIFELTPKQIRQFRAVGFLIIRNLLPREAVQPLIDEMETLDAVKRSFLDPTNRFDEAPFEKRLALVCQACSEPNWPWEEYFREQDISD